MIKLAIWLLSFQAASFFNVPKLMAQDLDPRALNPYWVFASYCVETYGSRERAISILANGNIITKPISDEILQSLHEWRPGGIGWAMSTAGGGRLLLDYDPNGLCSVRVLEADELDMVHVFGRITSEKAFVGGVLKRQPDGTSEHSGVTLTTRSWTVQFPGAASYVLVLTTAPKPVGYMQHVMSFFQVEEVLPP